MARPVHPGAKFPGMVKIQTRAIAIVDDEVKLRQALSRLLRLHDFHTVQFESGDDFLAGCSGGEIDCVLLDVNFPSTTDGFGVLRELRSRGFRLPVILVTAFDEPGNLRKARDLGAAAYLVKPVDEELLLRAIHEATGEGPRGEG